MFKDCVNQEPDNCFYDFAVTQRNFGVPPSNRLTTIVLFLVPNYVSALDEDCELIVEEPDKWCPTEMMEECPDQEPCSETPVEELVGPAAPYFDLGTAISAEE